MTTKYIVGINLDGDTQPLAEFCRDNLIGNCGGWNYGLIEYVYNTWYSNYDIVDNLVRECGETVESVTNKALAMGIFHRNGGVVCDSAWEYSAKKYVASYNTDCDEGEYNDTSYFHEWWHSLKNKEGSHRRIKGWANPSDEEEKTFVTYVYNRNSNGGCFKFDKNLKNKIRIRVDDDDRWQRPNLSVCK